jgi:cell wall-associated NlpC family hydrolase
MFASLTSGLRRSALALLLGWMAMGLFGCGQSGSSTNVAEVPSSRRDRIREERPPHPQRPYDVIHRDPKRPATPPHSEPTPKPEPDPAPEAEVPDGGPSSIPPASAGTNGSFTPPKSARGKTITPRTMARLESQAAGTSAVLLSGIGLAPPGAPERIKAAITAANEIVGRPYIWGGGHGSWYSRGYDCSGAVSYALAGGGFLAAPLNSGQFESWGEPGPGRWLTVYANAGHAYAVIAGMRWDTVGDARGSGPRWHPAVAYPAGFVARHPPGY